MTVDSTSVTMTKFHPSFAKDEYVALVASRLTEVQERIDRVISTFRAPQIVGVTKTFGPEAPEAALLAGLSDVGENYIEELEVKRAALADLPLRWHYLGALQSNKIARIISVAIQKINQIFMHAALGQNMIKNIGPIETGTKQFCSL